MDQLRTIPAQLWIDGDIGSRLLNAAVFRDERLGRMRSRSSRNAARPNPHHYRIEGTFALAVAAMLAHCRQLLRTNPIEIVRCHDGNTVVRVFGALEYVFDSLRCRISARVVKRDPYRCVDHGDMPQLLNSNLVYENIELMSPLCRPSWLLYVAYRPDGICGHTTATDVHQLALWQDCPHVVQLLDAVCLASYRQLRADPEFQRFRNLLSFRLIELAGTYQVSLALRARTHWRGRGLDARDVNRVSRYWRFYARMDRESPNLLPVLTAWLQHKVPPEDRGCDDAVPAIRQDLLDHGLPPRAWRYLVEHGPRVLVYRKDRPLTWQALLGVLQDLHKARWPEPPPRGFLGFLSDTAGAPRSYTEQGGGVPGWFWNWACRAARDCAHDPRLYHHLRCKLVQWAWLVREYAPRPDRNQQRRQLQWLQRWAVHQESLIDLSDQVAWGGWLRDVPWDRIERLQVVPLLSPRALREEGIAMHNCADRYLHDCLKGESLLLSLRNPVNGKRLALLGLRRDCVDGDWERAELSAPCNRAAPAWIVPLADAALALVRQAEDARPARRKQQQERISK